MRLADGRSIAQLKAQREYVTIDWTIRENVRAQLRVLVKRILRKYGYPDPRQNPSELNCAQRPVTATP